jgi:MoaA/NifB/PqqE/SkfB family radical SAM enzyme
MPSTTDLVQTRRVRGMSRYLYAPFHVQMVVIRKCNLACGYCNEYDTDSPPVPLEELKRRVDKVKALGAWAVEFTGGEPLEHPDILELVRYAKQEKKFYKVQMISNLYLWNEKTIHDLNAAGLDDLQVSVDGVQPNDVTVKVLKPMRKKLETLAKHAKFRVTMSGVVGSAPPGEAVQVLEFAKSHGFKPRVLLVHDGHGQLRLSPEQLDEFEEIKRVLGKKHMKDAGDYRSRLMATGSAPFKCRSGSRYLYIDEFGIVRWCSQTRDVWGVPLAEYSLDHLKQQFDTQKDCNPKCTVGCVRTASAPDRWRGQDTPDPGPMAAPQLVQLVQLGKKPSPSSPQAAAE